MNMKTIFRALVCGVLLSAVLSLAGFDGACEDIRQQVFRLHIIANSDSADDQAMKLAVRDRLLEYTGSLFKNCRSKYESIECAREHIDDIRRIACLTVRDYGCDYPVDAYVTKMDFTTRVYDDITLPAGEYDALRIVIGSGQGHNWWCVLFPALCLPECDRNELHNVMTDNEVDVISSAEKYEVRFLLVEWIEGLFSALHR